MSQSEQEILVESVYRQISELNLKASQLCADMARLASLPASGQPEGHRISGPLYDDLTSKDADLQSLQSKLDNGAVVVIEIGKARPRACYWLNSTDLKSDTAIILSAKIGSGSSEKTSIVKRAGLMITGTYCLSKYGA